MTNFRLYRFAVVLAIAVVALDYLLLKFSYSELKAKYVAEMYQSNKVLSGELYRVFYGLEDDFHFFESQVQDILVHPKVSLNRRSLLGFLDSHSIYYKVRFISIEGKEVFKMIRKEDQIESPESKSLYDLGRQDFFKRMQSAKSTDFYFSSMEANIINGQIERPLKPTVRISKKVKFQKDIEGYLVVNLDGDKISKLFDEESIDHKIKEHILSDSNGFYVASSPMLEAEQYVMQKKKLNSELLQKIDQSLDQFGSIELEDNIYAFLRFDLPRSNEKWLLTSQVARDDLFKQERNSHLRRIFWECLGYLLLVAWYWRDEKRQHQEQVVQVLLKERGEFIQNVSHQLKTPLAIIFNDLSNENQSFSRVEVQKEIQNMIKIVEDLLLLSQIESLQEISLVKESLLEVLNESVSLVSRKAKEKSILIKINIEKDLLDSGVSFEIGMLPELLKSAFVNLLDNAIDFSPSGSTVEVQLKFSNGQFVISIVDAGPGISSAVIQKIFSPYNRDSTQGRKGTGLGLSIVKKIVQLHHGDVNFTTGPRGTTFQVSLLGQFSRDI